MEIKKCARCGGFFETTNEVCNGCIAKDNKDLGKLKNYLEGYSFSKGQVTKGEVSANTGITMKNLNRFLSGQEFEGIYIPETLSGNNVDNNKKIIEKV